MSKTNEDEWLALKRQQAMQDEYDAWMAIIYELRERNVGDIEIGGKDNKLWAAIVLWGEELAELRRLTPQDINAQALTEKRDVWASLTIDEEG